MAGWESFDCVFYVQTLFESSRKVGAIQLEHLGIAALFGLDFSQELVVFHFFLMDSVSVEVNLEDPHFSSGVGLWENSYLG